MNSDHQEIDGFVLIMIIVAMITWSTAPCCYTVDDDVTGEDDSNYRDDKDKDGQWSWPPDNL